MVIAITIIGANRLVNAQESLTANFSGTVAASTCAVSGGYQKFTVNLGMIDGNTISRIGEIGPWVDFPEITLTGCPTGKNIMLELKTTATEPGFPDYIALSSAEKARGVAIAISVDGGNSVYPLSAGTALPGNGETRILKLKAAYVRTLSVEQVRVGIVRATAHFLLSYK